MKNATATRKTTQTAVAFLTVDCPDCVHPLGETTYDRPRAVSGKTTGTCGDCGQTYAVDVRMHRDGTATVTMEPVTKGGG
ncbi:MAG: hypothetical protein QGD90_01050 [Candidatus Hydrogenedentes bacterium]|nr:hypothetical protein [Candidatus Hydrogenedentota bacterium]